MSSTLSHPTYRPSGLAHHRDSLVGHVRVPSLRLPTGFILSYLPDISPPLGGHQIRARLKPAAGGARLHLRIPVFPPLSLDKSARNTQSVHSFKDFIGPIIRSNPVKECVPRFAGSPTKELWTYYTSIPRNWALERSQHGYCDRQKECTCLRRVYTYKKRGFRNLASPIYWPP